MHGNLIFSDVLENPTSIDPEAFMLSQDTPP